MPIQRIARIYVRKTNHDPCDLIDVARRQVDHLGRIGIQAKRKQTNSRFLKKGYLRFVFPTRAMRRHFTERIDEHCHPAVQVRFFKRQKD